VVRGVNEAFFLFDICLYFLLLFYGFVGLFVIAVGLLLLLFAV
tara:strand:+ start:66 stop:194 length:129 start_codon:yes stop_codon:yes gene_type:complete